MLQWEIDTSLVDLAALYGFDKARRIYRQSLAAVRGLGDLAAGLGIECAWRDRSAVLLAGDGDDGRAVAEECAARARAELPSTFLTGGALVDRFGLRRAAAAASTGAAECDPVRLAHGMLACAMRAGALLIHEDVTAYDFDARGARVALSGGLEIEGQALVLATGYAMPPFVTSDVHRMSASWAAVTGRDTPHGFWRDQSLIWEDATPYLYARTASDGRILVGGEDERIDDPVARDRLAPEKAAAMHRKLEAVWGQALPRFESIWSAAFSETVDGLPLIGPVPGCAHAFAAYGYGGNGITYSFLASRMIGDLVAGRGQLWFESFALDRPSP